MSTLHRKKIPMGQVFLHIFFILLSLCYVLPLWMLIAVSFDAQAAGTHFALWPENPSLICYQLAFNNPTTIIRAYGVTFAFSILSVLLSLVLMVPVAYSLSRRNFRLRRIITFILFVPCLFSGGMVPNYLLNSALGLVDSFWVYVIPGLVGAWNIFVIRTYFQGLPGELFECARLDGASELGTCFRIAVPLSTPVLASIGFLRFIGEWNSWQATEIYIRNPKLYSLQYLMQSLLMSMQMIRDLFAKGIGNYDEAVLENMEAMRFAIAVVAAVPSLIIFPFFQKYFKKGMVVGSVKG